MDPELKQFRAAAALENHGRGRMGRRYSSTLQAQAVQYWTRRQHKGDDLAEVAAALGVAPWSLHRWARTARFRPVQVVPQTVSRVTPAVVVIVTTDSVRIEGLDIEAAAQFVARLR